MIDRLFKEVVNLIILTEPSEGHVGSLLVESTTSRVQLSDVSYTYIVREQTTKLYI